MTTTNPNAIVGRSELAAALGFHSLSTFDGWWKRARALPGFPPPAAGYRQKYVLSDVLAFVRRQPAAAGAGTTPDTTAAEDRQAIDYSRRMADAAAAIAQGA